MALAGLSAAGLMLLSAQPALGVGPASVRDGRVGTPAIVAAFGSRSTNYFTPAVVIERGDDLTFVNGDIFVHDVRSVAKGPDDTAWCNPPDPDEPPHRVRNPRRFPKGKCPLLWTPPISMTNGVVESAVYGTKNLKPGTTVDFFCTVFPNMKGRVIVL